MISLQEVISQQYNEQNVFSLTHADIRNGMVFVSFCNCESFINQFFLGVACVRCMMTLYNDSKILPPFSTFLASICLNAIR